MLFGANGKAIQLYLFLATIKMAGLSEELTQANDFLQMGESEDLMVIFREDVTECDLFIRIWQQASQIRRWLSTEKQKIMS